MKQRHGQKTLWWDHLVRLIKAGERVILLSPTRERSQEIVRELKGRLKKGGKQ